jgi:hypothetical protein
VIGAPEALLVAERVPQVAAPHPTPETPQVTPLLAGSFCTVAVNVCGTVAGTLAVFGDTDSVIGGCATIVMVIVAVFVVSATAAAVRVTVGGFGATAGAVYLMVAPEALDVADNVPQAGPLQPAPDKVQVTPLSAGSPWTVAPKVELAETLTLAVGKEAEMDTGGGGVEIVMVAAADFVPSATEVAVTVTVAGEGTVGGAV